MLSILRAEYRRVNKLKLRRPPRSPSLRPGRPTDGVNGTRQHAQGRRRDLGGWPRASSAALYRKWIVNRLGLEQGVSSTVSRREDGQGLGVAGYGP